VEQRRRQPGLALQAPRFQHQRYYAIVDGNTLNDYVPQCLTSDGIAGDQVYHYSCGASQGQIWYTGLSHSTSNRLIGWSIENVDSGLYLDVGGDDPFPDAAIITWPFNGGTNQYLAIDT
jgi:Ricin-type beta-trefoil lectin domain-like